MRIRFPLIAALAAVALSSAPAHASGCLANPPSVCDELLPSYWQDPSLPWCPIGPCDWKYIG